MRNYSSCLNDLLTIVDPVKDYVKEILSAVVYGGWFFNGLAALKTSSYVLPYLINTAIVPMSQRQISKQELVGKQLKVDPEHMEFESTPLKLLAIDFDAILRMCDKIIEEKDFHKNSRFYKKVVEDEHWKENYADKKNSKEVFSYVKTGVTKLVKNLKAKQKQFMGNIPNQALILLSHILVKIKLDNDLEQKKIFLTKLGICSYYCPLGFKRAFVELYMTICGPLKEQTLQGQIVALLEFHRENFYADLIKNEIIPNILQTGPLDPQNIHFYEDLLPVVGRCLGLKRKVREISSLAKTEEIVISYTYYPAVRVYLERNYTPERIVEFVQQDINSSGYIKYELLKVWLLENGYTLDEAYDEEGRIKKGPVEHLLVNMRILSL